jgi:hypothetical protein
VESVVWVVPAIARRNCLPAAVTGTTIRSTVAARPIQTGRQLTGSAALLAAIRCRIARRMRGRTSRSLAAASKQA